MSTVYLGPLDGVITLDPGTGAVDVSCQVSNFVCDGSPSQAQQLAGGFCADSAPTTRNGPSQFAVQFDYMQDWGQPSSVSQLLWDADEQYVAFTFTPTDTSVPAIAGEMQALAGAFGGPSNGTWVSSKSMPCKGKPTITAQP